MVQRLFIGIPLPDEIKKELLSGLNLPRSYKITKMENLHITVLFLGDAEESLIPEIQKRIKNAVDKFQKFELDISGFGQFPPKGNPKIIYATGNSNLDKLEEMANEIRNELKNIGFTDKRSFKYHVTVARQKNNFGENTILPKNKFLLKYKADKVVLYKSVLLREGAVYSEIFSAKLKVE